MTPDTSALDWALRYADIGWHVFPCKANKTPHTEHGFLDATTDHAQIVSWWRKLPDAQIGIATGASGLCTIDLDFDPEKGKDGPASFAQLAGVEPHGCGLIATTPRGGRHYVYLMPDPPVQSRNDVVNGIDVKAGGGYIVVPSPASPGREWVVGDPFESDPDTGATDVCQMAPWVLDLVSGLAVRKEPGTSSVTASSRVRTEVASAVHAIPPSVGRSNWLQVIFAAHAALDGDPFGGRVVEGWSSLTSTPGQYKPGEAEKAYSGALLPEFLDGRQSVDSGTLWALARSYGWRAAGGGADDVEIMLGQPEAQPTDPEPAGRIHLLDWTSVADMPPVEWQIEGLVPEQSLTMLVGDTEAGKSFLALDMALRMVHGMPFCGLEMRPGSVIYLAGEGHSGMAGRLNAWRAHHRVGIESMQGRYLTIADGIPPLSVKTMGQVHDLVAMVSKAKGHPPSLVVVDTLSQALVDGDENDSKVVAPVLRGLSDVRKSFKCSVMPIHHLIKLNGNGKGPPAKPNKDSIRGSGALSRNVDMILGLLVASGGLRELHTWKQKDGEKLPPIGLRMLQVETGRRRRNGSKEISCVLLPDVKLEESCEPVVVDDAAVEAGKLAARVAKVVEAVKAHGKPIDRRTAMADLVKPMRKQDALAAISLAISDGLIVNVGTGRSQQWQVGNQNNPDNQVAPDTGSPQDGGGGCARKERTKEREREPGTRSPGTGPVPFPLAVPDGTLGTEREPGTRNEKED